MATPRSEFEETPRPLQLPDFRDGRTLLGLLVITVLTALTMALARDNDRLDFWIDLGQAAVFLTWISVCSAVLLQLLRPHIAHSTPLAGAVTVVVMPTAGVVAPAASGAPAV